MFARKRKQGPGTNRRPPLASPPPAALGELSEGPERVMTGGRVLHEDELQEMVQVGAISESQAEAMLAAGATEADLDEVLSGGPGLTIRALGNAELRELIAGPEVEPPAGPGAGGAVLSIELVPSTCWYSNVRSEVSKEDWDRIRRAVYRAAGYRCEVCGGRGEQHPIECHEVWSYDDEHRVQRLERMIGLCPACHQVKHMGHANVTGHGPEARAHLAEVNGWSAEQAERYVAQAFAVWQRRSRQEWALDIGALAHYGVSAER